MVSLDAQSTFSNVCNELNNEIKNWREFYSLIEKDTKNEIITIEMYDNAITSAKERETMGVTFICKPKYTFIISDDTFEKRDESENKENTIKGEENEEIEDGNFSFDYFGESETPFENFVGKIKKHFSHIEEKFDLMFNDKNINNDASFNGMIEDVKYENKSKIFVSLTIKACLLFCCWDCVHRMFLFVFPCHKKQKFLFFVLCCCCWDLFLF